MRWWGGAVLTAAVIVTGLGGIELRASIGEQVRGRAFELTYTAQVADLPTEAREVQVWVPLARTRANQQILARRIDAPQPCQVHTDSATGNDILHCALTPPIPHAYSVRITYDALVRSDRDAFRGSSEGFPDAATDAHALQRLLQPESLAIIDSLVQQLSAEATQDRATDVERARGIYNFVIAHMSYDKTTPGWGRGDTRRACLIGKGNCTDFHSLFVSMARAAGLPARFVIGATVPEAREGTIPGYHCWAEVYTREEGWIPVDASEAWKHPEKKEYYFGTPDPNKLLISVGRDLRLVPPQAGEPLNFFLAPYVEADGRPITTVNTEFHFRSQPYKEGST